MLIAPTVWVLSLLPSSVKVDSAWQARAQFYAKLQCLQSEQRSEFFTPDVSLCDLLSEQKYGVADVVQALELHPSLVSYSLPESWPKLRLIPVSSARGKFGRRLTIEWQAYLGDMEIPLGRGMSMLQVDPSSGKVERMTEIAELPWRAIGQAARTIARFGPRTRGS